MKYALSVLLLFSLLSCRTLINDNNVIEWVESNAICVHWTDFGKEKFDPKAIRIVLRSTDKERLNMGKFYLRTKIGKDIEFPLGKIENLKQEGEYYILFLFIRSEDLYEFFPEGKNYYNDDCYHIDLANMVGVGKIFMTHGDKTIEIGKSRDYCFYVGLK